MVSVRLHVFVHRRVRGAGAHLELFVVGAFGPFGVVAVPRAGEVHAGLELHRGAVDVHQIAHPVHAVAVRVVDPRPGFVEHDHVGVDRLCVPQDIVVRVVAIEHVEADSVGLHYADDNLFVDALRVGDRGRERDFRLVRIRVGVGVRVGRVGIARVLRAVDGALASEDQQGEEQVAHDSPLSGRFPED